MKGGFVNTPVPDCRDCEHCKRGWAGKLYDECELTYLVCESQNNDIWQSVFCIIQRNKHEYGSKCGPLGKNFVQRKTWWQKVKGWLQ